MLVIMAGMPLAGKTTLVNKLIDISDPNLSIEHIEPNSYMKELGEDTLESRVASWEICKEQVSKTIRSSTNDYVIIFDSCASKLETIEPLFLEAELYGHQTMYIFVEVSLENIRNRDKDGKYTDDIIAEYCNNFMRSKKRFFDIIDEYCSVDIAGNNTLECESEKILYLIYDMLGFNR